MAKAGLHIINVKEIAVRKKVRWAVYQAYKYYDMTLS